MNRYLFALLILASPSWAYKGSWKIDDAFVLFTTTANPSTGAVINTATPTYRVYEDTSDTALVSGSYSRLDSTNTDSLWKASITLSAANGFEKGKNYAAFSQVVISAATYESVIPFQVEAEVDANIVSDKLDYNIASIDADAITASAIQASAIGASELATDSITNDEIAGSAVTEVQAGLSTLTSAQVATLIAAGTAEILSVSDEFGGGGGGASASAIADAVWDELLSGHTTAGSASAIVTLIWEWVRNR